MSERTRVWLGIGLCVVAVVAAPILWVPVALINGDPLVAAAAVSVIAPALPVVGAVVISRLPRHRVGWLMLVVGAAGCVSMLATQLAYLGIERDGASPVAVWGLWLSNVLWPLTVPLLALLLLWFPDGHVSGRWRWLERILVGAAGIGVALGAFAPGEMARMTPDPSALNNPLGVAALEWLAPVAFSGTAVVFAAGGPLAFVAALLRWRRGSREERLQLQWVAAVAGIAFVVIAASLVAGVDGGDWEIVPLALLLLGIPAAMCVSILRYRLYDLDLFLNRTIVYVVASAVLLGLYLGGVQLSGQVLPEGGELSHVLPAALVALLYAPLRGHVQQMVNRRLFGHRGDAQRALLQMATELEAADPQTALSALVESIAEALRLPYVALYPPGGEDADQRPVAVLGRLAGAPVEIPMHHRGQEVGRLIVGSRSRAERLSSSDRAVLDALARHAAVAVFAIGVSEQLQQSRRHLVSAVEEERRRLRRDLHDGVGPTLAAVGLGLERAARELRSGTDASDVASLVTSLRDELQASVVGIRQIVHDLRPPALDDLGLVGALRARAGMVATASHGQLTVTVSADDEHPLLPAAVEAAAYRIVDEALANMVRHSNATYCAVRISANGALSIEVEDNGTGMRTGWQPGVGLRSMRERVAELGGSITFVERALVGAVDGRERSSTVGIVPGHGEVPEALTASGTCITVSLPLADPT